MGGHVINIRMLLEVLVRNVIILLDLDLYIIGHIVVDDRLGDFGVDIDTILVDLAGDDLPQRILGNDTLGYSRLTSGSKERRTRSP